MSELKRCSQCGKTKPLAAFNRDARKRDGLRSNCRDCQHVWHAANCDRERARRRARYGANADRENERRRVHRAANADRERERDRAWKAANPAKVRESEVKRRAREHDAFVEDVDPAVLIARDHGACCVCGLPVDPTEAHLEHLLPLSRGGTHEYANCGLAHPECNAAKYTADPAEFIPAWQERHDPLRPAWLLIEPEPNNEPAVTTMVDVSNPARLPF